jgi:putative CocE/NonD family hydrolase
MADQSIVQAADISTGIGRLALPTFHTAGWYDIFLQGTLDNYAATSGAGRATRLVVGPWTHERVEDPIGDLVFGARSARGHDGSGANWRHRQLDWFRCQLAGGNASVEDEAPIWIFVMGANSWRAERSWPLVREQRRRMFLHAGGMLSDETPRAGEACSTFLYDPSRPVPTLGGHGVMSPAVRSGPVDQRAIEARGDVLLFTSRPLEEDLEVTGRVTVSLGVQSSAPSTDWVARLCDVDESGRSINLCDGILRVASEADQPGVRQIDLWSTSNVFRKGHRLRLHVTSSSFPRWDRNLNTGRAAGAGATAEQRVFHSYPHLSFVDLPVIPAAA